MSNIHSLQAKCRAITVERIYTPGFTITADIYDSLGPFTTVLHVVYSAGANKVVSIVQVRGIGSDICIRNVLLDSMGRADAADYNISDTHMIYAMLQSVVVGSNVVQCCDTFDYTNCPTSNYIRFTVTDTGSIQFLSNPSGTQIWLAPTGQTPVYQNKTTPDTVSNLPVGNYDYILKLTNFKDYISPQPVIIIKDQIATVGPINLVPVEGCMYLTSSPPGAQIFMDGTPSTVVNTGFMTPKLICGLDLGQHCYKLVLLGYENKTGCITLGTGQGEAIIDTLRQLPVLTDITISPLNPIVTIGRTRAFSAVPIDQYGDPFPVTMTWSSSNTYVGIINPDTGVFSAEHEGSTIITVASGTVSKSTGVTVTIEIPVLTTITVSPITLSIEVGNSNIFVASPKDQFGDPFPTAVTWSSSNPSIGTIGSSTGIFTAITQGSTIITVTSGTVSGVAVANVTTGVQPPIQGGILGGNMEIAALILGTAMIGAVMVYKNKEEKEFGKALKYRLSEKEEDY
jgi:hypothetical protein